MLRVELDTARLFELGRRHQISLRDADMGYLVHCQLAALFGDLAPRPFAIVGSPGRRLSVLAYSSRADNDLRAHAEAYSDPTAYAACDWQVFASKPMPSEWKEGQVVGFETKVCPVIRKANASERRREGAEVDAFLAKCWEVGDASVPVDRASVYRDWLRAQLERSGGARLREAKLERFQRERVLRRTQGDVRCGQRCELPDATLCGTLEVADPMKFRTLLARGVGRHRAFGFGMLLLRAVANSQK